MHTLDSKDPPNTSWRWGPPGMGVATRRNGVPSLGSYNLSFNCDHERWGTPPGRVTRSAGAGNPPGGVRFCRYFLI